MTPQGVDSFLVLWCPSLCRCFLHALTSCTCVMVVLVPCLCVWRQEAEQSSKLRQSLTAFLAQQYSGRRTTPGFMQTKFQDIAALFDPDIEMRLWACSQVSSAVPNLTDGSRKTSVLLRFLNLTSIQFLQAAALPATTRVCYVCLSDTNCYLGTIFRCCRRVSFWQLQ